MSFYNAYKQYKDYPFSDFFQSLSANNILNNLAAEALNAEELLGLLSPLAENYLEVMAQKAKSLSLKNFGKAILLYTPLYLSNYCENQCLYCGFNAENDIPRKKLTPRELEKEAQFIAKSGLRHILILTGESRTTTPLSYLKECIKILRHFFSSISLEIYPLTESEYAALIKEGADGLTLYQEVYDQTSYKKFHPRGPKQDYQFRLDAPERAARAGMHTINIGALLGLQEWQRSAFFLLLHAQYLQDKYPQTEISISIPRLRPQFNNFKSPYKVSDKNIVQIITAARIFMPRLGITLSTRENPQFRDHLIALGITKMSAGSTTAVGGHTQSDPFLKDSVQFEISDTRDVAQIKKILLKKGYEPVLKDWVGRL